MISIRNLTFQQGNNLIFDEVNFSISDNQKVGLVGPNGAGKTTLLNLIMKNEQPDAGKIEVNGTIGFVPQEIKFDPILDSSTTIRDYLDPNYLTEDYQILKMLNGLELSNLDLKSSPKNLSGGQKTKLALIRSLVLEPDLLLLDEPTNYLDQSGKIWVANLLKQYPKTLIIISHDLDLLDQSIDKVLFINTQFKNIEEYSGNYSKFIKLKEEKEALSKRQIQVQQKHIKRMEESVKVLLSNRSEGGVRQRVILQRRLEKLKENLPEMPVEAQKIKLSLPTPDWVGELPIRVVAISKSYGKNLIINNVNFSIRRGERIALIGPNGAGKSTLIKILVGLLKQDSGEIIKDENLSLGYYSQEFESFDLNKNLLEAIQDDTHLEQKVVRPVLAKFLFPAEKVHQSVSSLSGGEKTRLSIAMILLHNYNLLILDEPTTYLDPLSQRIILEGLKISSAAMLIVSHTEEFIKELNPSRVLLLPENRFDIWDDQYLTKVNEI